MSENISLKEIKKIWPSSAPDISNINKYVEKYKGETIVIKYGGNVLIDRSIFNNFIEDIGILNKLGLSIVVVHGGGPRTLCLRGKESSEVRCNQPCAEAGSLVRCGVTE